MSASPRDPLLAAARFVLALSIGIMAFMTVVFTIASPALLVGKGAVYAHLAENGVRAGPELMPAAAAALLVLAGLFAGGVWFLLLLRRIVLSVGDGDPFVPANAQRLSRMGWIALGSQVVMIPLGALLHWIAVITRDMRNVRIEADFGLSGGMILLTLVLFILARVFRQGTQMRAELEGTV